MSAKGYTNEAKVEAFLNDTIEDGKLADILLTVEDYIDGYTGRNFKADSTASARKFAGNGSQELDIDECVAVSKVELGNNEYGDTFSEISAGGANGYYLWPENYSQEAVPARKIHLRGRRWTSGWQNHRITAKWGYSAAVPAAISQAATILTAAIYRLGDGGGIGGVKSEKIGDYSVSFDGQDGPALQAEFGRAKALLDKYKKLEI